MSEPTPYEVDHSFDDRKDPLGARMKERYEQVTRQYLPKRTFSVVRIDGRSFHTYTKGLARPYDGGLMEAMGETAAYLCKEVAGCELGYVQSDEISLLLTDFASEATEPFFGGNVQKIASVTASMASAYFNSIYSHPEKPNSLATFDARVFSIPNATEVANYFQWREQDAKRNAISMVGQAHFSAKELQGVSTAALTEKLRTERGIDINDFPEDFLRGQVVERVTVLRPVEYFDKRTKMTVTTDPVERRVWERKPAPDFRGHEWIKERIPALPDVAAPSPELSSL
jgi:tRNA(His) guanylyltransferase